MALCDNEILIGYTIGTKPPITVAPFTIIPSGVYNGKSYYTWYEVLWGFDVVLRWDIINSRWELGYDDGGFIIGAFLNYTPTNCPYQPGVPGGSWVIIDPEWSSITTEVGAVLNLSTEETECFPILVWNKQCEFAQCVYKYLQMLQFGSIPCSALETLKNKRRILEILNCYDTRDIPTDTTDYNIFTYQEIKNLLNH